MLPAVRHLQPQGYVEKALLFKVGSKRKTSIFKLAYVRGKYADQTVLRTLQENHFE